MSCIPQLSSFDDFFAYFLSRILLKTSSVRLASRLHFPDLAVREISVIVFVLVAAVILLVAVTFISSIDSSHTRRH